MWKVLCPEFDDVLKTYIGSWSKGPGFDSYYLSYLEISGKRTNLDYERNYVNRSHWWPRGWSRHMSDIKCTVMIWRSWVWTPIRSNLGYVVLLSWVVHEPKISVYLPLQIIYVIGQLCQFPSWFFIFLETHCYCVTWSWAKFHMTKLSHDHDY